MGNVYFLLNTCDLFLYLNSNLNFLKGGENCVHHGRINVLDSGFLERMNTLLANGEVPGLFEGDEYTTLCTQIKVKY